MIGVTGEIFSDSAKERQYGHAAAPNSYPRHRSGYAYRIATRLEQAEIDVTITWYEAEACQLIETAPFDLMLIGDHPPELNAAAILDDLSLRGTCPPVLILRGISGEKDNEYFRRLGAIGVIPKRDPVAVLGQVTRELATMQLKAKGARAGLAGARSLRAAS